MAAVRGSDVLEASQVRVCSTEGEVVGAGFLVAADVVCTCAHVVAQVLGVPDSGQEAPGGPVDLDFPLLEGRPKVRATVVSWRRGGQDVALLRLEAAVEGARPVQLVDGTGVWGHTFRALGYPGGADRGVWASGTLRAGQGSGWVQMEVHGPGPRISGGFSGSPVWDDIQDGVVGMTVAAHVGERTAYLLPSAELVDEETLRSRCPFQGLAPFSEDDAEFFHGRETDIARVYAAVRRRPVTLVAGPSGSGKSSLVGAGVLPRLRSGGMSVTELRPVPGARASAVLARVLTGVLEPGLGEIERLAKAEKLARLLDAGDGVPAELRSRILARGEGAGHVLFVDQFEEYAGAEAAAARDLLGLLAALAGKDGAAVLRVVATARPDSLDVLVTAETSDLVSDAVEFLAPLAAEGLAQAVTAPVDDIPGLWFEPGLPERIVTDAGDEPGRMTLVQFALTELWKRRSRSMLTHAAYDELGGVAGALVGYADDTIDGLTPSQRERARRLFVQLARPDGDAFLRRPTRAADLAPELIELARKLAPSKLVVLSQGPGGTEEIVDLAHEALTRLWPRLQRWLANSRDFRAWQEQLRADLRRWQAQQMESPRLLSGTDLAEAARRLAAHPDDVSADERGYVLLSLRHSRRGARIKQAAVGTLAVLTVLALVLAWSTVQSLRETEATLRIQAAALLAQAAEDTPDDNPATALQLALAAWNIQQTPKTRDALMHQYARDQYLVGAYPSVWKGRFEGMDATSDGRTLVVASKPSGGNVFTFTVVAGALEGKIRTSELRGVPAGGLVSALSPDGSLFALAAEDAVRLWRLNDREGRDPIVLNRGEHEIAKETGGTLDFSSDGERLLLTMDDRSEECKNDAGRCVPAFAEAWEVPSGDRLPVADSLVAGYRVDQAAFTTDPGTVAVTHWKGSARQIEVKELTTGRQLYGPGSVPGDLSSAHEALRAGGEVAISWTGGEVYTQALGRAPGPRIAIPAVNTLAADDATGNYSVEGTNGVGEVKDGGYVESILADVRTGQAYRTRLPTSGDIGDERATAAAVPQPDGGLTVLVPVGTTLMAVRAEASGHERFQTGNGRDGRFALSPDGSSVARVSDHTLEILDASRTLLRSLVIPVEEQTGDWMITWTADSQSVVVWGRKTGLHRSYAASDLGRSMPLPQEAQKGEKIDSVVGVQGSEIVLVTEKGTLARLDAARGTVLSQPFLAHPGPNSNGPFGDIFKYGQIMARPGHPGQVAVVTRAGGGRGEILLWDVRAPERVATLTGPAISFPFTEDSLGSGLVFSPDGSRLAVQNSDGKVRVWDVDRQERLRQEAPDPTGTHLIGFTPDGRLLTYLDGLVKVHDLANGSFVTLATTEWKTEEITDTTTQITRDHQLVIDNGEGRRAFNLRPEAQFRTLCAGAGRDYTKDERKLLPKGTPSEPPCS
ncbi:trypsin-like peptidase domain-containing protein [Streptomyces sp. NBC_01443]|uniref:nSTAND1 domain-containing NTPase n=1 Tax=Streptomyces sp. NBC_01443 TaxID=2903868 RepID=UPI002258738B|nr:trypsin-like peptidase domain-containing protein [Streptomyces sp. NBC_01443]MCX4632261.1 trypsin-like peptidase domain-containing protein [Streptomyces sp. NBC_01443]